MYVDDLYVILHAFWVDDSRPLLGFFRIQVSLLLLLCAVTASRPGAIVEGASAKGSNKALLFKHIELIKVRTIEDASKSTIVANVTLENVKNKETSGKPKKFSFRLEVTPAFCIVSHILSIGISQGLFMNEFTSVRQIFKLYIPPERESLHIKWKSQLLDQPFFCNVKSSSIGTGISREEAFPYAKLQQTFVRLGLLAGFKMRLELYSLRRGSGRNINSALDPVERNQVIGNTATTYEKHYTPLHIARDFQSIYFGSPAEDRLISSVGQMGLTRDRRAPTRLNEAQMKALREDPKFKTLCKKRDYYRSKLHGEGYRPISQARGTRLYGEYDRYKREVNNRLQKLVRDGIESARCDFYESIDSKEVKMQLDGTAAAEVPTLQTVEYELCERAAIASMLPKPFQDDSDRIEFIEKLAELCRKQEKRQTKTSNRKRTTGFNVDGGNDAQLSNKRIRGMAEVAEKDLPVSKLPLKLSYPMCLICIGNEAFADEVRMKPRPRKDVLNKHVDYHFSHPEFETPFQCFHPDCFRELVDKGHFKRHAYDVHNVLH
ncbi:hypothetical protein AA0117_g10090 [Alternaria alternata]|uniref:C2H2-type domain-containing protein n=1 Tax=Alternaria alternata TaxID=5599 RepID=A0A4Q4N584_ALTAL|nr:hypothetical protein AA0117_g10090 [Alternaria alternata]